MKLLHDLLGLAVDPGSGAAWAGTVVLLVVCVRLLLLGPARQQLAAGRRSAALRPRLAALRVQHADDPAAHREAVRRLQATEGPGLAGGLPLLVQLPVLLGLYRLLAGFTLAGAPGGNGVFGPAEVRPFATATLGGCRCPPRSTPPRRPWPSWRRAWTGAPCWACWSPCSWSRPPPPSWGPGTPGSSRPRRPPPATRCRWRSARPAARWSWLAPASVLLGGLLAPVPLALVLYVNGTGPCSPSSLRSDAVMGVPARPRGGAVADQESLRSARSRTVLRSSWVCS
ncbi:YidC/Oxa1 family membrane protein insertase [Friedmanniella luteola]|nr:YidC/Oxa1 family membrane protein insertase [Friedmanniella luteola]